MFTGNPFFKPNLLLALIALLPALVLAVEHSRHRPQTDRACVQLGYTENGPGAADFTISTWYELDEDGSVIDGDDLVFNLGEHKTPKCRFDGRLEGVKEGTAKDVAFVVEFPREDYLRTFGLQKGLRIVCEDPASMFSPGTPEDYAIILNEEPEQGPVR